MQIDTTVFNRQEPLHSDLMPYLDTQDDMPMLRSPLVYSIPHNDATNAFVNAQYLAKKQAVKQALKERDYTHFLLLHERPYRLDAFNKVHEAMTDSDYWKALNYIYVDTENMNQNYELWCDALFNSGRKNSHLFMTPQERKALKAMPETITIYRGTDSRHVRGMSWTTDKKLAEWFSLRFRRTDDKKKRHLAHATVSKDDVLGYLTGRNESEIVCDFAKVNVYLVEVLK